MTNFFIFIILTYTYEDFYMKKTREEVAYDYLKDCGPCLITYPNTSGSEVQILLTKSGDAFWLNDEEGPDIPYIELSVVLQEAKHLLLKLFVADMKTELTSNEIYGFEDTLRASLKKAELTPEEVKELKVKFLDAKEELLG